MDNTHSIDSTVYINFPIQLVHGVIKDRSLMIDWLNYHIYNIRKNDSEDSLFRDDQLISSYYSEKRGEELHKLLPINSNPIVGVEKNMFFEFIQNSKKNLEVASLLAFLALKSIIGNKPYIKTGNDFLLSRMDGSLKIIPVDELSPEIQTYKSHYFLQKIKSSLIKSWGLKHYAKYSRGFYASFKLSIEELAFVCESKRNERDLIYKAQKSLENEARAKAINKIEQAHNSEISKSNTNPNSNIMTKILFFDVETTGLDSKIHGIHQLSGILEIDGEPVKSFDFKINPAPHLLIDENALNVAGKTMEEIRAYPSEAEAYRRFIAMLLNYIDKFNKNDKAFLAGWNNAAFDNGFLRAFFERNGDKYFGSWFWSNPLDVMILASQYLIAERPTLLNFKLMTVAAHLLGAIDESSLHDATYDIELTRKIYQIVKL